MKKIAILFILVITLFAKNLLLINSYSIQLPWTKNEVEGVLNKLNNKNIKIYIEFMDTKKFSPTKEYLNIFYNYLKNKYKNIKFDIIAVTDDNALNFVRNNYNALFKNTKVFFAGINNFNLAKILDKNIYAGVFEKKEPLENLKLLKRVNPNIKTIYLVADNSNSANSVVKEYKKSLSNIKNIKFIYINTSNLEEVIEKIQNAPLNSAMMLLTPFSFKINNKHLNYKESIKIISNYFNFPIVIHTDLLASLKNSNIIGGKVTDAISQGEVLGDKILKYLNGENMKNIGFTFERANKMYLNVLNLKKFNVDVYKLGYDNAIYVNKPTSFFEIYKNYIILFVSLFFILLVFSIIMFIKNIQLRKYSKKVEKINSEIDKRIQVYAKNLNKVSDKEIFKELLKDIIFQLKYPIKKLDVNNEYVKFLSKKIKDIESLIEDKKDIFFVKKELENLKKLYNLNFKIEGDDFEIKTNRVLFDLFILKLSKNYSYLNFKLDNKKIEIFKILKKDFNKLFETFKNNDLDLNFLMKLDNDKLIVIIK